MLVAIAQQNSTFNFIESSVFESAHLYASKNGVQVVIKQHLGAKLSQRYSVKSTYKAFGASYSSGNRRSEVSYRTKNTSKRFANIDDAVQFALSEIN